MTVNFEDLTITDKSLVNFYEPKWFQDIENSVFAVSMTTKMVHCMLQYYEVEVYYFVAVIILKTPCNSLIIKILFWRSVYRCYTDNNTVRLRRV